jgi:uncharacterized membrane protein
MFILFYAFSFLILISVWLGYTRNVSMLHIETGGLVAVNVLLLFLVSIEPFLFNLLLGPLSDNVSLLYAFDLGSLFLIQTYIAHAISSDKSRPADIAYRFKLQRNTFLISSMLFFASMLPNLWSWKIMVTPSIAVPVRMIFWIVPLILPSFRRLWQKRNIIKVA